MTAPKHLASRSKMPISDASLVADNRVCAAATPRPGVIPVALAPRNSRGPEASTPAPNPTAAAAVRLLLGEQAKLLVAGISLKLLSKRTPMDHVALASACALRIEKSVVHAVIRDRIGRETASRQMQGEDRYCEHNGFTSSSAHPTNNRPRSATMLVPWEFSCTAPLSTNSSRAERGFYASWRCWCAAPPRGILWPAGDRRRQVRRRRQGPPRQPATARTRRAIGRPVSYLRVSCAAG
jgi:hypothetical protein